MLVDDYPEVVKQIREMEEICKAEQPEFDALVTETDRILLNMFIATSDERGLGRFEKEFGIAPLPGQSVEERRVAVMIRAAKKNLSLKDALSLVQNYSQEIGLEPDYSKDELNVTVGDGVNNVRAIYKTLDEIIGLNVYIYFTYIAAVFLGMQETPKVMEMEMVIREWLEFGKMGQPIKAELRMHTETVEEFQGATVTMKKDLWHLDGDVKLDGSRKLDAEEKKEGI